ncbi:MAG: type II toxin-antitoxin system VapC family toxin [Planctomycetes bacterium]|nr:type II toxin-antitoxin system VapC family toxin [Planctomycetota bacterium]
MEGRVLVDTSALVGLFVERDEWHGPAVACYERLRDERRRLLTTWDVFQETVTAIRKWAGHPQAVTVGEFLRANAAIQLVPTGEETREAAWRLFRKHRGLVLSFTDCTSFVVMRHFGITEAFTFDDDFRRAGFTVLPPPA